MLCFFSSSIFTQSVKLRYEDKNSKAKEKILGVYILVIYFFFVCVIYCITIFFYVIRQPNRVNHLL